MGHPGNLAFVKCNLSTFTGPLLEIGSRDYGNTQNLRGLFPGADYVGVDALAGKGVDLVLDLTADFATVDAALGGQRFGSVFCLCVLEHCQNPFKMAENITALLRPGGVVYVSAPFAWKCHAYPSDYWRFTPEGVRKLFPALRFPPQLAACSTDRPGHILPLDDELGRIRISGSWQRRDGHFFRGLSADLLRCLGAVGLIRWLTQYRYLMRPTTIDMIGILDQADAPSG